MSIQNLVFGSLLAICLLLILRWSTARSFRFSPPLLFFALYVLQQALGCMFLVNEGDPFGALARNALALGILGFTMGVGITTSWASFRPEQELLRVRTRLRFNERDLGIKLCVLLAGYLVSVAIVLLFFRQGGGMPLLQGVSALASGDQTEAAQQIIKTRRMELTYFQTTSYRGQGYVDQLRNVALPYVFFTVLIWARASGSRVKLLAASALGVPVLLFLMGTGQRHPTLAFLICLTILWYLLSDPRTHRRLLLVLFGIGVVMFLLLTFMLGRYSHTGSLSSDLGIIGVSAWYRILYSNAVGTIALFRLFPNPEPFRYGMTWLNDLQGFLPGPYVAFSAWLYQRLYGAVGTAAPMCFGEMFANFGLLGVLIGGTLQGILLQALHVRWARVREYRAEHFTIYALGSMAFARWAMGGLLGPIQFGLLGVTALYVMVRMGQVFLAVVVRQVNAASSTGIKPSTPLRTMGSELRLR